MKYVKVKEIKIFAKEHNRQLSKDFLESLDRMIEQILIKSHQKFNGHHNRLTADLLPKIN